VRSQDLLNSAEGFPACKVFVKEDISEQKVIHTKLPISNYTKPSEDSKANHKNEMKPVLPEAFRGNQSTNKGNGEKFFKHCCLLPFILSCSGTQPRRNV
jgi:hypothetical protein